MKPSARRAVASAGIVLFLIFYVWLAVTLAEFVPDHPLAQLAYYAVAGLGWGFPLYPLLSWAKRGGDE